MYGDFKNTLKSVLTDGQNLSAKQVLSKQHAEIRGNGQGLFFRFCQANARKIEKKPDFIELFYDYLTVKTVSSTPFNAMPISSFVSFLPFSTTFST